MSASASRTGPASASARAVGTRAAPSPDEQRVAEHHAQPGQRVAHARLAEPDPVRGARDAALAQERVERHEEVEVDPAELHCAREYRASRDLVVRWVPRGLASRPWARGDPGPDHRRQPRRADDGGAAGPPRGAVALRRAARGDRDPPRAGHFQLRTMEILRQVGLEDPARETSLRTYHPRGGINAVESLAGRELAVYIADVNEGIEGFSPTHRLFLDQDALEPLLRERALELGATAAQPGRGGRPGAGRRRRHGHAARPRQATRRAPCARGTSSRPTATAARRATVWASGWRATGCSRAASRSTSARTARRCCRTATRASSTSTTRRCAGSSGSTGRAARGFLVVNTVGADVTTEEAVNVGDG